MSRFVSFLLIDALFFVILTVALAEFIDAVAILFSNLLDFGIFFSLK